MSDTAIILHTNLKTLGTHFLVFFRWDLTKSRLKSMKVNEILTYYYGVCALVFQILHILEGEWDPSLFLFLLVWQPKIEML